MKAQYKDVFLVIAPSSAICLILAISQMVMSIVPANVANETIQYRGVTSKPMSINIHIVREIKPAPRNNPIAAIPRPFKRDLLSKAIKDIKPKTKEVIKNVKPNIFQSMNITNAESITPIKAQ